MLNSYYKNVTSANLSWQHAIFLSAMYTQLCLTAFKRSYNYIWLSMFTSAELQCFVYTPHQNGSRQARYASSLPLSSHYRSTNWLCDTWVLNGIICSCISSVFESTNFGFVHHVQRDNVAYFASRWANILNLRSNGTGTNWFCWYGSSGLFRVRVHIC